MSYSKVAFFSVFILIFANGCSLFGLASLKKAEAEQKKLLEREKIVENIDLFEFSDIYFDSWDMKEIKTSSGEQIEMNYRGRVFADVKSPDSDSVFTIPLYHNRMVFFLNDEFVYQGYVNRVKQGENGVWIFELVNPDTTLLSTKFNSVEMNVESDLEFDVLRYGLDRFDDLPFEKISENYSYISYNIDVENIREWGLGGVTSDSTYRVVPLNQIEKITYKSGPVPPTGMGATIFMAFAMVADIVILTTAGLIWLL